MSAPVRTRILRMIGALAVAIALATPTLFARQGSLEICAQLAQIGPSTDTFNGTATSPPFNWHVGDAFTFAVSGPPGATLTIQLPSGTPVASGPSPLTYVVPAELTSTTITLLSDSSTTVNATISCVQGAAVPSVPVIVLVTLAGLTLFTGAIMLARRRVALRRA